MSKIRVLIFSLILASGGCASTFQVDPEFVSFGYRVFTYDDFRAVNLAVIAQQQANGETPRPEVSLFAWRSNIESLIDRVGVNPVLFDVENFVEGALHTMGARNYQAEWPDFFVIDCRANHAPGIEFEFEVPDGRSFDTNGNLVLGGVHLRIARVGNGLVTEDEGNQPCNVPAELQPTYLEVFAPQNFLQSTPTLDAQLTFGIDGNPWDAGFSEFTVTYDNVDKDGGFDFKAIALSPSNSGVNAVLIVELGGGFADE